MRGKICRVFVCAAATILVFPVSGQVVRGRIREAASPYTAEFKLTHTQQLADGNVINTEWKEVLAVDAQHRRMTAKTGGFIPGETGIGKRVTVFDPVARTLSVWTSPGQRATVDAIPEPGAQRGCSPNSIRGKGVNLGVVRAAHPRPLVEDLGTDIFQGIEARGTRRTTTIPAGEIGNEAPLVRTRETWIAVAAALPDLVVREISDDPQNGKTTRELVNLDQREPDESSFQPPAGYEIVNKSAPQTTCSGEEASAPQQ